jgi:hypothetical protein
MDIFIYNHTLDSDNRIREVREGTEKALENMIGYPKILSRVSSEPKNLFSSFLGVFHNCIFFFF